MDKDNQESTQTDNRLSTVSARTEKDKRYLVAQLRKTPVVQIACERNGISRATYYRWRKEDIIFARAADHAIEGGKFFINDLAESKLLQLVQNSNLTAIIFWLKHNHPSYSNRVIHEYDLVCPRTCTEEDHAHLRQKINMRLAGITDKSKSKELRRYFEQEEMEEEYLQEDEEKLEAYQKE